MREQPLQTDKKTDAALDIAKRKTRSYAQSLWSIISRHSRYQELGESRNVEKPPLDKHEFHSKGFITLLSAVPYLLAALFFLSFFWDFDELSWTVAGYTLQFQGLLKILTVSGLIGFLTNWLAINMLFKPAKKRPILGHGLVPAQKNRIAYRLAQAVSEDLINPEIIKRKINESNIISRYREQTTRYVKGIIDAPSFRREIKTWVVSYVDDMVANPEIRGALAEKIMVEVENALENKSIEKVALRAYTYIKGQEMQHIIEEALGKLPSTIESGLNKIDDLLDRLPEKIEQNSESIENIVTSLLYKLINQLDVHALVEDNLKNYDEQHISSIIRNATNEQLRYIQYLGAVLGMIGGLVIWEPLISFSVLGLVLVLILGLDNILLQLKKR